MVDCVCDGNYDGMDPKSWQIEEEMEELFFPWQS
jgi:hypothetical protein